MKKRRLLLGLIIGILAFATYSYIKHEQHLMARHHLLCETLEFGMSEDEVLDILHHHGEFTMRRATWGEDIVELGINFIDSKGKNLYKGFELGFFKKEYWRAYIQNFDNLEVICEIPLNSD